LAVLEADPDADTVNALAELATVHAFAGSATEANQVSDAALAQAQALGLPDAILAGLFAIGGISHGLANRPAQAAASLREAVLRAEAAGDSAAAARALLNLGDVLVTTDPAVAAQANRAAMTHCRRIGHRYWLGTAEANLIQALLLTGDWIAAEQVYTSGVNEDRLGEDPILAFSAALMFSFTGDQARLGAALAVGHKSAGSEDTQDIAARATALAAAAAAEGSHEQALRHAKDSLAQAGAVSLRHDALRWAWPLAADAAVALGDKAEGDRLLEWLKAHPFGHIPLVLHAEGARIHARLLASNHHPDAGHAFTTAIKSLRDLGSPYHLAKGLLDHAEYLAALGDDHAAEQVAAEAGSIAERLRAKPLIQRARHLAGSSLGPQQPPIGEGDTEPALAPRVPTI
jgi:tetratricopeptide (TPR) repeat protein